MPRIPTYELQYAPNVPQIAPRVDPNAMAQSWQGMEEAGQTLAKEGFRLQAKMNHLKQVQQLVDLKTRSTKDLVELQQQTLGSPEFVSDPEGTAAKFQTQVEQIQKGYLDGIGDDEVATHFREHFGTRSLIMNTEMTVAARKKRIEAAQGTLYGSLQTLQDLAQRSGSEADLTDLVRQGMSALDGAAAAGVVGLDDAPKLKRNFLSGIGKNLVNRDLRINPTSTLNNLLTGGYDKLLNETDKEKALERAQRQTDILVRHQDSLATREESRMDRQMRQVRDQTEMDAWSRLSKQDLTLVDIEDLREKRLLDASGYNALRRAIASEEGVENLSIALELEDKVLQGRGDRDEILRLAGKAIKHETAGKLLEKIRLVDRTDDISKQPVYRDAYDFIKTKLTTTGPLEELSLDDESRRAYALREFDARARKGEDLWTVADDVVTRGASTKAATTTPAQRLKPRFLTGDPADLKALDEAERTAVEKYQAGELTPDLFKLETESIEALRKAARDAAKRAITTPGSRK